MQIRCQRMYVIGLCFISLAIYSISIDFFNFPNKTYIILTQDMRELHDKLRARDLPNIYYRTVCSAAGSTSITKILTFVAAVIFAMQSKWSI